MVEWSRDPLRRRGREETGVVITPKHVRDFYRLLPEVRCGAKHSASVDIKEKTIKLICSQLAKYNGRKPHTHKWPTMGWRMTVEYISTMQKRGRGKRSRKGGNRGGGNGDGTPETAHT